MFKCTLAIFCVAVMAAPGAHTPAAGPWVRSYVVGFYGPAFRYGGRADFSRGTEIRARRGLPARKHDSLRDSGSGRQDLLADKLAHAAGSRSSGESPRERISARSSRRVFPYLAGGLSLSRL